MNKGELVILFPRVHDSYNKWVNCEVTKEAVPACFLLSASGARCITLCRESSSSSDSEALRTLLFYKSHSFWRTCTSFIYTIIHKWMKKRWLCLLCHFIIPTWTETKKSNAVQKTVFNQRQNSCYYTNIATLAAQSTHTCTCKPSWQW